MCNICDGVSPTEKLTFFCFERLSNSQPFFSAPDEDTVITAFQAILLECPARLGHRQINIDVPSILFSPSPFFVSLFFLWITPVS